MFESSLKNGKTRVSGRSSMRGISGRACLCNTRQNCGMIIVRLIWNYYTSVASTVKHIATNSHILYDAVGFKIISATLYA